MIARISNIVETLCNYYNFNLEKCEIYRLSRELTSYEFLILTILSQNTSDKLAKKAFLNLVDRLGKPLDPGKIIQRYEDVLECIKISGMYNRKLEAIMNLSRFVIEKGIDILDREVPTKLRTTLLELRGIGKKSVDVFLLFKRVFPTFPVDTHIRRVCSRLGICRVAEYDEIASIFLKEFCNNVRSLMIAHLVLILHGRELCKSRRPRCHKCPISNICVFCSVRKSV